MSTSVQADGPAATSGNGARDDDEVQLGRGLEHLAQHDRRRALIDADLDHAAPAECDLAQQRSLAGRVHRPRWDQSAAHRDGAQAHVIAQPLGREAAKGLRQGHRRATVVHRRGRTDRGPGIRRPARSSTFRRRGFGPMGARGKRSAMARAHMVEETGRP